ncbi:hypothetical protein PBY51_018533 [Eleginops maclovinus]|uniref:Uncharacterized protein n=1 Tax=Eleginops maclovinus TaxID=56733 RepID=A0AAN7YDW0_ELEMC|nr:hypothetical protein PBY51_018533 [Eleginops maclovinus]
MGGEEQNIYRPGRIRGLGPHETNVPGFKRGETCDQGMTLIYVRADSVHLDSVFLFGSDGHNESSLDFLKLFLHF